MANQWLRLWHDMPNDPKWRTIARLSKQPISLVQAVYLHLLVDASRNVTRGHVDVTNEDLASALDVTEDAISAIRDAMQARVLEGDELTGWEKRQPKREDSGDAESGAKSSAERKRAERERKAQAQKDGEHQSEVTPCHDLSRNVTTDKDKEEIKSITPLPPDGVKNEKLPRGFRLPTDWGLDPSGPEGMAHDVVAAARDLKAELNIDWGLRRVRFELDNFRDYWHAKAGRTATKVEWLATWRTWLRKAMPTQPAADPVRRDFQAAAARNAQAVPA